MRSGKICRYKVQIDSEDADKYDHVKFELIQGNGLTVIITKAIRINDCDFKENRMTEGQALEVNFPQASYVVVRAEDNNVNFQIKYSFVNMDASDFTSEGNSISNLSWEDFVKTSLFKYICFAILGLFIIIVVLVGVFFIYKKKFGKILYKV